MLSETTDDIVQVSQSFLWSINFHKKIFQMAPLKTKLFRLKICQVFAILLFITMELEVLSTKFSTCSGNCRKIFVVFNKLFQWQKISYNFHFIFYEISLRILTFWFHFDQKKFILITRSMSMTHFLLDYSFYLLWKCLLKNSKITLPVFYILKYQFLWFHKWK